MTMLDKLLQLAEQEVGYLEKKTNAQLDNKTTNAGDKNFTKYSRDLVKKIGNPFANGVAWCQMFVTWLFCQTFGYDFAKVVLGGWTAYTPTAVNYYKQMGRWYSKPQVGDQIFFKNSTRICHTGVVYAIDSRYVYTIEGNTSSSVGVVPNGGGVFKKKYLLTNPRIAGYGRPDYEIVNAKKLMGNPYQEPTNVVKKGSKGEGVYWLQYELREAGYKIVLDGDMGKETDRILREYQKSHQLDPDGECGRLTRASLKKN